jgi:hypothetical protein
LLLGLRHPATTHHPRPGLPDLLRPVQGRLRPAKPDFGFLVTMKGSGLTGGGRNRMIGWPTKRDQGAEHFRDVLRIAAKYGDDTDDHGAHGQNDQADARKHVHAGSPRDDGLPQHIDTCSRGCGRHHFVHDGGDGLNIDLNQPQRIMQPRKY